MNRRSLLIKSGRLIMGACSCLALAPFAMAGTAGQKADSVSCSLKESIQPLDIDKLKISVVYDNNPFNGNLSTAWGFSCLVEGSDRTILFDTGGDEKVLLSNLKALGISPGRIELITLSHEHWDHISGLFKLLEMKSGLKVHIPASFSRTYRSRVEKLGSNPVGVTGPVKLTANCLLTGEMDSRARNEQALIIDTTRGLVLITGCAHPGVVEMAERARSLMQKDLLLVMGGFHLKKAGKGHIREVVAGLKALGVRHVAGTHCTGGKARKAFARAWGGNYVECGAGRVITGRDLKGVSS